MKKKLDRGGSVRPLPLGSANDNCYILLPLCWNFKLSRRESSGSCLTFCPSSANTTPSVTKVTSATDDIILLRVQSPCLSYFQSKRVLYPFFICTQNTSHKYFLMIIHIFRIFDSLFVRLIHTEFCVCDFVSYILIYLNGDFPDLFTIQECQYFQLCFSCSIQK